jgi:hypothetical protein
MKIIKLDKRFSVYRWHGHQAGFRFSAYNEQARAIEKYMRNVYNTNGYVSHNWKTWTKESVEWGGYYGKTTKKYESRPYFITVKSPEVITAILLACPDLTSN